MKSGKYKFSQEEINQINQRRLQADAAFHEEASAEAMAISKHNALRPQRGMRRFQPAGR